jgi:hypothetical protein
MQDVATLVEKAQEVRAQAATNMNDRSSRSHTILTIWLETTSSEGSFHSKLNLVDLAGSERRKAIGEHGSQTNHEGDAINKSLLTLQNVVMALGQKGAVPSYRTSKLTHFLKDSIGGNCKTTLCACIWGDPSKMNETLATCRCAVCYNITGASRVHAAGHQRSIHDVAILYVASILVLEAERIQKPRVLAPAQHGIMEGPITGLIAIQARRSACPSRCSCAMHILCYIADAEVQQKHLCVCMCICCDQLRPLQAPSTHYMARLWAVRTAT